MELTAGNRLTVPYCDRYRNSTCSQASGVGLRVCETDGQTAPLRHSRPFSAICNPCSVHGAKEAITNDSRCARAWLQVAFARTLHLGQCTCRPDDLQHSQQAADKVTRIINTKCDRLANARSRIAPPFKHRRLPAKKSQQMYGVETLHYSVLLAHDMPYLHVLILQGLPQHVSAKFFRQRQASRCKPRPPHQPISHLRQLPMRQARGEWWCGGSVPRAT